MNILSASWKFHKLASWQRCTQLNCCQKTGLKPSLHTQRNICNVCNAKLEHVLLFLASPILLDLALHALRKISCKQLSLHCVAYVRSYTSLLGLHCLCKCGNEALLASSTVCVIISQSVIHLQALLRLWVRISMKKKNIIIWQRTLRRSRVRAFCCESGNPGQ